MQLKISHPNPIVFQEILESVLNLATIVALGGTIPSELEMNEPSQRGRYWYREDKRYHLAAISNNWWANVASESENSIVLEFRYRYDTNGVCDLLCHLIVVRFGEFVELV